MHPHRPVILLTGFGPFPGVPANATSLLVPRLTEAAAAAFYGYRVVGAVLATEWAQGPRQLDALVAEHAPVLALHFGVSSRAQGFVIETRAVNLAHAIDACGASPAHSCLDPASDAALPGALPALPIVARLRGLGIPATISRDAGTYLCNAILYRSRVLADGCERPFRSGFIHLPSRLIDERRGTSRPRSGCPLNWAQVMDGSLEVIATTLGRWPRGVLRPRQG